GAPLQQRAHRPLAGQPPEVALADEPVDAHPRLPGGEPVAGQPVDGGAHVGGPGDRADAAAPGGEQVPDGGLRPAQVVDVDVRQRDVVQGPPGQDDRGARGRLDQRRDVVTAGAEEQDALGLPAAQVARGRPPLVRPAGHEDDERRAAGELAPDAPQQAREVGVAEDAAGVLAHDGRGRPGGDAAGGARAAADVGERLGGGAGRERGGAAPPGGAVGHAGRRRGGHPGERGDVGGWGGTGGGGGGFGGGGGGHAGALPSGFPAFSGGGGRVGE